MSFYANSEILAGNGWFVWYFLAAENCDAVAQLHLGPVQALLHSNLTDELSKRAASESIWYGSFS